MNKGNDKAEHPSAPKTVMGMINIPVVFLAPVCPYNARELAWFPVAKANKLIAEKRARRGVDSDFNVEIPADVAEAVAEITPKEKPHVRESDDFNTALELAEDKHGKKAIKKVLEYYGIEKDGRRRKQVETDFGYDVLGLLSDLDGMPGKPPRLAPWQSEDLRADLEADWAARFARK